MKKAQTQAVQKPKRRNNKRKETRKYLGNIPVFKINGMLWVSLYNLRCFLLSLKGGEAIKYEMRKSFQNLERNNPEDKLVLEQKKIVAIIGEENKKHLNPNDRNTFIKRDVLNTGEFKIFMEKYKLPIDDSMIFELGVMQPAEKKQRNVKKRKGLEESEEEQINTPIIKTKTPIKKEKGIPQSKCECAHRTKVQTSPSNKKIKVEEPIKPKFTAIPLEQKVLNIKKEPEILIKDTSSQPNLTVENKIQFDNFPLPNLDFYFSLPVFQDQGFKEPSPVVLQAPVTSFKQEKDVDTKVFINFEEQNYNISFDEENLRCNEEYKNNEQQILFNPKLSFSDLCF